MLGSINRELWIERADLSSHQQSDPWTASGKWHLQSQLSTNWTIYPPINPKSLQSRVSLEKVESWVLLCSQQHWFSFVSGRMYDLKLKISLTGINLEVQSPVCIINLWIDISLMSTNWVGDDGDSILGKVCWRWKIWLHLLGHPKLCTIVICTCVCKLFDDCKWQSCSCSYWTLPIWAVGTQSRFTARLWE